VLAVLTVDEATHIEDVIGRSTLHPARVGAALLSLELSGRARQLEGQRWIALGARTESR
jgi:predicted Rossmann fold nucleotide-binding protein DprA/Smf involved in DNA uptake